MFVDTFDIERRSCDSVTNKFGRILLQFCQTYDMVIANGRFGPESEQYTFMNKNGCSVIDYLIISKSMFRLINNFAVLSNSESCHFPISIALGIFNAKHINNVHTEEKTRYDINAENAHVYSNCISENIDKGVFEYVFNSLSDVDVPIDNIILEFEKAIFTCSSSFKKVTKWKYKHGNKSVWFDTECKLSKRSL